MTLVIEPFYRHASLGPGAPLTHLTGSSEGDGFYDWAGRRLFLPDGEPDPACPGAYRYQHNPTSCDVDAPDSDPRSPRYEPPHLRHQPGDTWLIDHDRPRDPYDPGPYGSPGWYQDQRTGRHRRDETPDPLPAEDWEPPKDAWYPSIEVRTGQPSDDQERSGRSERSRTGGRPRPRPRNQFWSETDQQHAGEDEYRFDRLRENAWDDFMVDSEDLAAAHHQTQTRHRTALDREAGGALALWIALMRWLIALIRSTTTGQGDGLRPSFCSLGHLDTGAAADRTHEEPQPAKPGTGAAADRTHKGPQAAKAAAPPLTLPARRPDRTAMPTAMAQAIAGAQRARAGVASWA